MKKGSQRLGSPDNITSELIRAFLFDGNPHPAKLAHCEGLFDTAKADAAVTYPWSLGLGQGTGVLHYLSSQHLRPKFCTEDTVTRIWIDILFVDQMRKDIMAEQAKAQEIYMTAQHHIVLLNSTTLERGWCIVEVCLRRHALEKGYVREAATAVAVSRDFRPVEGHDYIGQMKFSDEGDRAVLMQILHGLNRNGDMLINMAVCDQAKEFDAAAHKGCCLLS